MPVDSAMYQQYLKLRYQWPRPTPAADVVRRIKYGIRREVERRLSATHKLLDQAVALSVRSYSEGLDDYQVAGISFSFALYSYSRDDVFEPWGKTEWRKEAKFREGHDRNGEYYVLKSDRGGHFVLTPSYTFLDYYRDGIKRWGKALAWRTACNARDTDIEICENLMEYGEEELEARLEFAGEDDIISEYFSPDDDLTSILDWLRDKIDSRLAEQQRHAA
jgi:hypothetical protein